ncbi:unnamed protein product [Amoebophrya sp. A25]|nr:unnamed protein product [Amoebophrya sp. A25]|eukprot:GSA25T00007452001.1
MIQLQLISLEEQPRSIHVVIFTNPVGCSPSVTRSSLSSSFDFKWTQQPLQPQNFVSKFRLLSQAVVLNRRIVQANWSTSLLDYVGRCGQKKDISPS